MTYVTCRLTAKNRDQLRNPTLGNRARATFFTERLNVHYKQVGAQLPASAVNVTLLAFSAERRLCCNRSISPGCWAHSSKPTAVECGSQLMGQADGQTDRRTDARQFCKHILCLLCQKNKAIIIWVLHSAYNVICVILQFTNCSMVFDAICWHLLYGNLNCLGKWGNLCKKSDHPVYFHQSTVAFVWLET